jgi:hypothetical protein
MIAVPFAVNVVGSPGQRKSGVIVDVVFTCTYSRTRAGEAQVLRTVEHATMVDCALEQAQE